MKRLLVALALLLLSTSPSGAQSTAAKLKPLIWGADPDGGVPYVFLDPAETSRFIGLEVDIAEALSHALGRPIEFRKRAFENLINDVERGDIDLAMNGLEIRPERLTRVRFTKPYYVYELQLVVRADSPYKSLAELKSAHKSIGTLGATAAMELLKNEMIATEIYDDQEGLYKDLSLGRRIDGVLLDLPAAKYYAAPGANLKYSRRVPGLRYAGPSFAEGLYGIAVHKDNKELQDQLDAAIDRIRDNGDLKRILEKWQLWNAEQERLPKTLDVEAEETAISFGGYFPLLLRGAYETVRITLAGMALAVLLGLPIALSRLYGPAPLRWLAIAYIEFFRGIPVLLLLYFLYYGLASATGLKLGPFTAAVIGFGLNYAAYEAEIYRGGIASIPLGQWEAAASLGMSGPQTFFRIVLPQAIRVILPPMTNDFVALFKDTSVVSIIAVVELCKEYQILTKSGGGYFEIGLTTAALYLVMSIPLGHLSRYLEHRWGGK